MSSVNDVQVISAPDSSPTTPISQSPVNLTGSNVVKNISRGVLLKKDGSRITSHGSSQLPVRIVQAVGSSGSNSQVRKIIQVVKNPEKGTSNVIHIRSPMKSGNKLIGAKILGNPNAKLKVGEKIKIQKATSFHQPYNSSTISTPTKGVTSAESSSAVFIPTSATFSSPSPPCFMTGPSMVVPSNFPSSPIRTKPTSSWTPSTARNKRPAALDQCQAIESKRRRTPTHGEKGGKGLRHFAMLVCEKVKHKRTTTYNEVADELVADYAVQKYQQPDQQYDQKNIRRRVYDALNVLMAMNIIYKDKKDIHWVGLPTNSAQEVQQLQSEKIRKEQRIQQKTSQLQELILQQIAFKNLVQRNKRLQETQGSPPENSSIQLPFIIVNTSKKTVIDCSISNDKYEYLFNFNNTFEIHDDIEVLKRMGMAFGLDSGTCSSENLEHALTLVPPALKPYLEQMAGVPSFPNASSSTQKSSERLSMLSSQSTSSFSGLSQIIKKEPISSPSTLQVSAPTSTLFQTIKPDPNDQEVAMVTTQLNASCSNSGLVGGSGGGNGGGGSSGFISCSSSSHTSSSRPHSAGMMSITPLSSSRSSADVGFDDDDEDVAVNSCDGGANTSSRTGTPLVVDTGFVS